MSKPIGLMSPDNERKWEWQHIKMYKALGVHPADFKGLTSFHTDIHELILNTSYTHYNVGEVKKGLKMIKDIRAEIKLFKSIYPEQPLLPVYQQFLETFKDLNI